MVWGFMRKNTLAGYMAGVLLCILMLALMTAEALAKDGSSGIRYEEAGATIIKLMEDENCRPGYIKTEIVFLSQEEVEDFASYFYNQYYYGSVSVKVCYTIYTDKPGKYYLSVYTDKPQEAAREQRAAEKMLEDVAAGMNAQGDYDKAMEVYQWTYDHFEYDYSLRNINVYSALKTGETVCNGYTRIFQALCTKRGLDCEIVYGEGHAWNKVWLEGQWRYVDITWNKNLSENRWLFLLEDEMSSRHRPLEE